ncbi:class II aldolase/adducin family protein [bacterium]|nr:class II aldolase/adducin family protein [FCB group bacterium]MBL7191650.1 class II aldolase/adducin family protein [bacterium]
MSDVDNAKRRVFLEVCHRIYRKGFAAANDGNVSCRWSDNFLTTPTGLCKGDLKNDDLIIVDSQGNIVEGKLKPSSELPMHLAIYRLRPDVQAVVHAHPPYCTGFATAGIPLEQCVLPEIVMTLGSVPLTRYGTPSTEEIPSAISEVITKSDAVLLANHGAVTVGKDLMNAYYKLERIEHFAHILFIARQLGGEVRLSPEQVSKLYELRRESGAAGLNAGCITCNTLFSDECGVQGCALKKDDDAGSGGGDDLNSIIQAARNIFNNKRRD